MALSVAGCVKEADLALRVQRAGGEAPLKRECQMFVDAHDKTGKDTWLSNDPTLPPIVAELHPQVVMVGRSGAVPVVDIQVSGGFSHHGLLVVVADTPAGFAPRKSTWSVTKIAAGVFEYRE